MHPENPLIEINEKARAALEATPWPGAGHRRKRMAVVTVTAPNGIDLASCKIEETGTYRGQTKTRFSYSVNDSKVTYTRMLLTLSK